MTKIKNGENTRAAILLRTPGVDISCLHGGRFSVFGLRSFCLNTKWLVNWISSPRKRSPLRAASRWDKKNVTNNERLITRGAAAYAIKAAGFHLFPAKLSVALFLPRFGGCSSRFAASFY